MQFCLLQFPIPYCVSLMVIITRHVFINIFQTEHTSAVKFDIGLYEKNVSFFLISKSQKVFTNQKKIGAPWPL